jgi:predicted dehydrogenase
VTSLAWTHFKPSDLPSSTCGTLVSEFSPRRRSFWQTTLGTTVPLVTTTVTTTTAMPAKARTNPDTPAPATSQETTIDTNPTPLPLRTVLLGAGIFASTTHAAVLEQHRNTVFAVVGVWSRRRTERLIALADRFACPAYAGDADLLSLLARDDVDALVTSLPLDVQPQMVRQILQHNAQGTRPKHVLSEKPIGPTVDAVTSLVELYESHQQSPRHSAPYVWSVAENFRYEPGIVATSRAVATSVPTDADSSSSSSSSVPTHTIGTPLLASLQIRAPFLPDNQFLNTPWRKNASWYGGLFIDSFVHHAAGLRAVLGEVETVSAVTSDRADYLPGVDTLAAQLTWSSGVQGVVSVTYAGRDLQYEFGITGTTGTVSLERAGLGHRLTVVSSSHTASTGTDREKVATTDNTSTTTTTEYGFTGVEEEFLAFAGACRGQGSDRNTPREALRDLALVETLLASGQQNGRPLPVPKY